MTSSGRRPAHHQPGCGGSAASDVHQPRRPVAGYGFQAHSYSRHPLTPHRPTAGSMTAPVGRRRSGRKDEFWGAVGKNLTMLEDFMSRKTHDGDFDEFWEEWGVDYYRDSSSRFICIAATSGWCLAAGIVGAVVGVADAAWSYSRSAKSDRDKACLVMGVTLSVAGVFAPGARMPGRAF